MDNKDIFDAMDITEDDYGEYDRGWYDFFLGDDNCDFFDISDSYYDDCCKDNMELYDEVISCNTFDSIDECVNYAIKNCNHAAFIKYYMDHHNESKTKFIELLTTYLERAQKKGLKANMIKLLKPVGNFWRSPYFDATEENFNSNSMSGGAMSNWKKGIGFPARDTIIQLGFWLELDLKQVNQLLALAGCERLYAIDLADVISMFYLDYFTSNKDIPLGIKRLVYVKDKINTYASKGFMGGKYVSHKNKTLTLHKEPLLVFDGDTGVWNIEKELDRYREIVKEINADEAGKLSSKAGVFTQLISTEYHEITDESKLDEFITRYSKLFNNKYYGHLLKVSKYMLDARKYQKNFECTDFQLYYNLDVDIMEIMNELERLGNTEEYKIVKQAYKHNRLKVDEYNESENTLVEIILHGTNIDYNKAMFLLNTLWYASSFLEDEIMADEITGSDVISRFRGSRFKVNQLLEGREEITKDHDIKKGYMMNIVSKDDLIRFALITGREDEISEFMNISGFWSEDLGGYINDANDMVVKYAIAYRDALIDRWLKEYKKETLTIDESFKAEKLRESFPFLRLVMTIYRDIQLVLKCYYNDKEHISLDSIMELKDNMIYPVRDSNQEWFGYLA